MWCTWRTRECCPVVVGEGCSYWLWQQRVESLYTTSFPIELIKQHTKDIRSLLEAVVVVDSLKIVNLARITYFIPSQTRPSVSTLLYNL